MNTLTQLDQVERSVRTGDREGAETKAVTMTQSYPVGLHDLWDACTDGGRISRWLLPISGDLREGGRYQLEGNAGGVVEECVPRERIAVTWEYGGDISWVVATFSGDDDSATVHIEHTAHVDQDRWDEFGPGAVGIGWDSMLLGLSLHLGSGESMDAASAAAWMASDEGKRFMTLSGQAWCEAQIRAGEDAAAAEAASGRCIAAYTG